MLIDMALEYTLTQTTVNCIFMDISVADDKVKQLLVCEQEISHWMNGNRLKINKDKTQFVWLGTPHQLSRI